MSVNDTRVGAAPDDRLLDAVLAVGADLDPDAVLTRIVEAAADVAGAAHASLTVLAPDSHAVARVVRAGEAGDPAAGVAGDPAAGVDAIEVPVVVAGELFGALRVTRPLDTEFTGDDDRRVRVLAAAAGVAVHNARLYDEARGGQAWRQAASEVTRLLLSGVTSQEVCEAIARHVRDLCAATDVSVFLPTPAGALRSSAGIGPTASSVVGMEVDPERSLVGTVFREGVVHNLREAEVQAGLRASGGTAPPIGPILVVPLTAAGSTRGVLAASRPPGAPPFPDTVLAPVRAFAEQAELAYEVAERRRDAEALTLFADRDRIARNLHDLVIQRLFATGMGLEGAANVVAVDPADAARRIQRAVSDLDATIREIRTTVFALQRPADRAPSLRSQVIEIADAAAATLGFGPSVQFDGLVDTMVPDDAAEHLLAVLREALSNVSRHARASAAGVAVSAHHHVVLRVSDNGVGMPANGRRSGVANMAARASLLGGTLTIGDAEPGTVVEWRVPLRPA